MAIHTALESKFHIELHAMWSTFFCTFVLNLPKFTFLHAMLLMQGPLSPFTLIWKSANEIRGSESRLRFQNILNTCFWVVTHTNFRKRRKATCNTIKSFDLHAEDHEEFLITMEPWQHAPKSKRRISCSHPCHTGLWWIVAPTKSPSSIQLLKEQESCPLVTLAPQAHTWLKKHERRLFPSII